MAIRFEEVKEPATNKATSKTRATNREPRDKSTNGRPREAFNAYQREYMRRRRDKAKSSNLDV